MNTPQRKEKMGKLKKRVHIAEQTVLRLQQKIERITREEGEHLDELFQNDLISIMNDNNDKIKMAYPEGSFARLFWEEQLKASLKDDMRQVRWHPCMIKWCLNLKLLSTSAYHALRTSGFVTLPSERTLRDYTSYFSNQPGFMNEIDNQLFAEVSPSLPSSRRYISIIIDEMKIKEGLVFNKHSGKIIGFTSLGDINDELSRIQNDDQPQVAKHVLVLMVRGILFKLNFPYAHFGTRGATSDILFPIVWEAIRRLEAMGLKVLCSTADGASSNRKFFRLHHDKQNPQLLHTRHTMFILRIIVGFILSATPTFD